MAKILRDKKNQKPSIKNCFSRFYPAILRCINKLISKVHATKL